MQTVFTLYSSGVKTNRDAWVYNFSKATLAENMQKTIAFYNSEVKRYQKACAMGKVISDKPIVTDFINYDSTRVFTGIGLVEIDVVKNKDR